MEMSPLTHYWDTILESLRLRVSQQTFETWFHPLVPVAWAEDQVEIQCPNFFFKDWVSEHYQETLESALGEHCGRPVRCVLSVDEQTDDPKEELFDLAGAIAEPAGIPAEPAPAPAGKSNARVYLNADYTFDSFVMGEGSKMAHAASIAVSEQPGRGYNPLFLHGGVGLGKTHLMHAIGHAVLARNPHARVCYVTAEQFMNDLIFSIQKNRTYEFKSEYRNVDVLLVDDVAFLAGKESTQEEFFHTFNALYNENKQIVLTSDRPPKEIPTLEERLRSRFEWGLMVNIAPPDLETRIAILKKKVETNGIYISDECVEFIAANVTSNIRKLEGALIKLQAFASLTRCEISLEMAKEVLSSVLQASPSRAATIADAMKVVSDHFSVPIDQLKSKRRTQDLALARQVGMYLAREKVGAPFEKIGRVFGNRDHTTVMHAVKKIQAKMDGDPYFRGVVKDLVERLN
ncbi:chromosomal replication initiator protein DnaA [bacterium]|nr:chromosomal replication initiator protein DnaA [bacterium]